jgi:hypothetical protein
MSAAQSKPRRFLVRVIATSLVATLGIFNLRTQLFYADQSERANQVSAVMLERLAALGHVPTGKPTMLDIPEMGIDNVVGLYTRGHPAPKYSGETTVFGTALRSAPTEVPALTSPVWKIVQQLGVELFRAFRPLKFSLKSESPEEHEFHRFQLPDKVPVDGAFMITAAADRSVINQSADRPRTGRFYARKLTEMRNHLAQVESSLGHIIMPGVAKDVALWQHEPDFGASSRGMQATGRHILFEVVNPVPGSRMLLEWTRGTGRDEFALPPSEVFGYNRSGFGFVGRGAARMLSDPLVPREIDGRFYVAVDMRAQPQRLQAERKGLAALYNQHLGLDPRSITGYARNISLLSEDEVDAMKPPQSITRFPADLFDPGLLFSGIYEDGWIAEVARIRLGSEQKIDKVRIRGQVPSFDGLRAGGTLAIVVDGQEVARRQLQPGNFEFDASIPVAAGARWIELRADTTDLLSAEDQRLVSTRLISLELVAHLSNRADTVILPQAIKSFSAGVFQPGLSFSGIYDDGWLAEVARIQLGSETRFGRIRIRGEVPGFNKLRTGATIGIVVDGREVARRQLQPGDFELEAAIPEIAGPRWIEIRSDMSDRLSAADPRVASILLKSIELVESAREHERP